VTLEFLIYTMCAVAAFLVIFKPKQEKWAFGLLSGSFAIAFLMYMIAVSSSWVPPVNL